jgi:hypothetical protein
MTLLGSPRLLRRPFANPPNFGVVQDVKAIEVMRQMRYSNTSCCFRTGGRLVPVMRKHVAGVCGFWRDHDTKLRPIDVDPNRMMKVCVHGGYPDSMKGEIVQHSIAITIELIGDQPGVV